VEKHGEVVLEEKQTDKKYGETAYCGKDAFLEALCQPVKLCKYITNITPQCLQLLYLDQ
jgi:hypothetical protein